MSDLKAKIYAITKDIPEGYVLTYGLLAALAGRPGASRYAARCMTLSEGDIPNHRVVNSMGATAHSWLEQRTMLESEGVTFKKNGNVDLKRHLWQQL